jgi:hypothetical protein
MASHATIPVAIRISQVPGSWNRTRTTPAALSSSSSASVRDSTIEVKTSSAGVGGPTRIPLCAFLALPLGGRAVLGPTYVLAARRREKARFISASCSSLCALGEPVAGLALSERFTVFT